MIFIFFNTFFACGWCKLGFVHSDKIMVWKVLYENKYLSHILKNKQDKSHIFEKGEEILNNLSQLLSENSWFKFPNNFCFKGTVSKHMQKIKF